MSNIIIRLRDRESFLKSNVSELIFQRRFYLAVVPNYTVNNVKIDRLSFFRKFSPDGRFLISICENQTHVEIFEFLGSACNNEIKNIFKDLFKLKYSITLDKKISRECMLFTFDGKFVIVVSSKPTTDDNITFSTIIRSNESIHIPSEDYKIYCVELITGKITDFKSFICDKIYLSNNQGLYLYKNTLSILSVQHQTIHLYTLTDTGLFVELQTIGRFLYDDDEMILNCNPISDLMLNSLKQKLLSFLFTQAYNITDINRRCSALIQFYRKFDILNNLCMWRLQILDENNLILKYVLTKELINNNVDHYPSIFVFYDVSKKEIFAVYDENFFQLYENFADNLIQYNVPIKFPCSITSSYHARNNYEKYKRNVKKFLYQFPLSSQSFSSCPYLDFALFSYDVKHISSFDRAKMCEDNQVKFFGLDGAFKFKLDIEDGKKMVSYIFHPYEPFVISLYFRNRELIVNFHLRKNEFDGGENVL